ncbi:ATPase, T2SS/T4P/T4SS family [Blastococcus sp. HT6-30]|uniref:ATPase, T2SS/T4P/T4SS family n=1 Tax=Blastococcus sp. HT6-30 TaxID=3144843 RepID=UPI00321A7F89
MTRRHMAVNIRKFVLQAHSLDELVALGTVTAAAARFLEAAVASGLNILVSGGTQAGKTTLTFCIAWRTSARGGLSQPFAPNVHGQLGIPAPLL